jgi:Zn finger protein HypA/HybF involved in hydrogenase expression
MTLTLIEDALSEEEQLELQAHPTVKCSWCGQLIRIEGEELALAICPTCYERMLADYERALKARQSNAHASDR